MAPKRKAAKGGKQAGGKGKDAKKPQKVEQKPAPKAVASKRKASESPAPSPAKKAAAAKKGRAASPSPAPGNRQTRGRSAVTKKVEEPKATIRSKSNNKTQAEEKTGRVTRTVVQEVEEKKSAARGRSTSKASKAPATPKQKKEAPKEKAATPKQKAATPKQKTPTARQRSATPKQKDTPKQKESSAKQRSATPKSKAATPRGRSATPKQKAATPKQQTPKKATTPKQKTVSPKSKPAASPKLKAVTPKTTKTTPKKKETPVSQQKQNARRTTSRSRRSNAEEEIEKETVEAVENESNDSPEVVQEDAVKTDNIPSSDESKLVTTKGDEEADKPESPESVPEESADKVEAPIEESKEPLVQADKPSDDLDGATDAAGTPVQEKAENASSEETAAKESDEDIAEEAVEKEDENVEEDQEEIVDQQTEAESAVVLSASEEKPVEAKEDTQAEEIDTGVEEEDVKEDQAESEQISSEEKECESAESEQVDSAAQSVQKPDQVVEIDDSGDSEEQMEVEADSTTAANNFVSIDEGSEDAVIIEAEEAAPSKPVETLQDVVQDGSGDTGEKADKPDAQADQEVSDDDVEEIGITTAQVIEVPDDGISNTEQPEKDTTITGIEIGEEVLEEPVTNGGSGEEASQRKRKHDDLDNDGLEEIAVKRSRLSTDEQSLENGSKSEEDVAKDFVIIEMSDVPPSKSQEVVASLPTETVVTSADKTETVNPVYNRAFVPNPAFSSVTDSKKFSIVSYNILADCHLLRNDYSFTEQKYLEPDHRLDKIIEELVYLDSDIICLQEVDPIFFSEKLYPQLKSAGYEGLHIKRTKEYFNEGEATFFRTNRFTLVDSSSCCLADLVERELVNGVEPAVQAAVKQYMDLADVLLVTRLKCNLTGQEVTVGNIHVQWGQMKLQDVQCVQVASAVKEIVSRAGSDQVPHIICGDFNSPPMSPGYLVAKDGYPSGDDTINLLQQITGLQMPDGTKSLVDKLWPAFQHTSSSLKSVYNEVMGSEPAITSYNGVMKDTVDYIFYSSTSLDGVGVLQTAAPERVKETGGTPNLYFPSDHISLKAVLAFK